MKKKWREDEDKKKRKRFAISPKFIRIYGVYYMGHMSI